MVMRHLLLSGVELQPGDPALRVDHMGKHCRQIPTLGPGKRNLAMGWRVLHICECASDVRTLKIGEYCRGMWKKQSQVNLQKSSMKQGVQPTKHVGPWHAVSVTTGQTCCESARGLIGRRFLAARAPRLPLPECTLAEACACKYKHHEDRRAAPRRKEEKSGLPGKNHHGPERRTVQSRREED